MPDVIDEEAVFRLWDQILAKLGPVVFDKSPQYLGNRDALTLITRYRGRGNDVRLFADVLLPDAVQALFRRQHRRSIRDSPDEHRPVFFV